MLVVALAAVIAFLAIRHGGTFIEIALFLGVRWVYVMQAKARRRAEGLEWTEADRRAAYHAIDRRMWVVVVPAVVILLVWEWFG